MSQLTREDCLDLDQGDELSECRNEFILPNDVIYLDGNSLGALPKGTLQQVSNTIENEWGKGLIQSWNKADWVRKPMHLGNKIAPLIGAQAGEVLVVDSTSVNLFKLLTAALRLNKQRKIIVLEASEFPTDLYISEGVMGMMGGYERRLLSEEEQSIESLIDESVAVVLLSHIDYKTGRIHDMDQITKTAHENGALVIWDLCHSVGVFPVELNECDVDFAVGCTYKFLNGGPGAPSFLYVKKSLQGEISQPLTGWLGHAKPFDFATHYQPAQNISQFICGTAPILSFSALESGLAIFEKVPLQGIREKSQQLTDVFINLMEQECSNFGFQLLSPKDANDRGSEVSYSHSDGFPIMQALISHGIIGDFRAPNVVRFGFSPLYLRYSDVWEAVTCLKGIMESREWDRPQFKEQGIVT